MVFSHPIGIRQIHIMLHDTVTGLVVNPASRVIDLVEDDVLVIARLHPIRQLQAIGIERVEYTTGIFLLPGHNFLHTLDLDTADGGRKLAHAEIETLNHVLELPIVAVLPGKFDQVLMARNEHATFTG